MDDVPDKAGHEMTVGARIPSSAVDRRFHCPKAASKDLHQAPLHWADPSDLNFEACTISPLVFGLYNAPSQQ
jgi:hypothetical protein